MKKLWLIFIFLQIIHFQLISQNQILTFEAGNNLLIHHTHQIDDDYTFVNLDQNKGYMAGINLRLNSKEEFTGKLIVQFTHFQTRLQSDYDHEFTYGNSDLILKMNHLRLCYAFDFTWGNRLQYFINAGPSFSWLFNIKMDGDINTFEINGSETHEYHWSNQGNIKNQISRGVFSLYTKTGFNIPLSRKTSFQIAGQLIYDLNNETRDQLDIAANKSINSMLFFNLSLGLNYTIDKII